MKDAPKIICFRQVHLAERCSQHHTTKLAHSFNWVGSSLTYRCTNRLHGTKTSR